MNYINIIPQAGLCNRLRVVFSYLYVANENNKSLNVYWQKTPACNGSFLDVFLPIDNVNFLDRKPDNIDYEGHNPCIKMNKIYYDKLLPNKNISNKLCNLSKEIYDAIHIRRTDHVNLAIKKQKFTPDIVFENFIEKSNKRVYLACDNSITQQKFLEKYKEKIFFNKIIRSTKDKRQTSLEDSVIDLFMCIKSDKFLGTKYSSYTDLIRLLK